MKATLINPQGQRVVVEANSPQAQQYFGQGFKLQTAQSTQQPAQPTQTDYGAMYGLPDLQKKAEQTQTDYQTAGSGQQAFVDALKKALLGQDTETQGFQAEKQRLIQQQYSQPTSERERLIAAGITDPFERQKLISQSLGTTDSALSAVSSRLAGLGKTREDLVQQGVKGYEADLATKDESRRAASDALKEAMGLITKQQQADITKQEKATETETNRKQKVADEALAYQRKLDFEKFKAGLKPAKGSGGGTSGTSGTAGSVSFTPTEKKKIEQAGLSNAPRQNQLDFLFGKKTSADNPPTINEVYSENTTPFKNFIKDIQETAGMNIDPNKANNLYNDYQEAQQAIDQGLANYDEIIKNPNASLFKHLLKAKKASSSSSDEPPPLFGN